MSKPHSRDEKTLLIHDLRGRQAVEAYHLALYLGYAQQHLLRKQVLTDWSDVFEEGVDYELVHGEPELRRYEAAHQRSLGPIRAMKPGRGRLFFLERGLEKLLDHTSKSTWELRLELERAGLCVQKAPLASPGSSSPGSSSLVTDQAPALLQDDPGNRSEDALPRRRFEYDVLERLLAHLRELDDPALRGLAITSAETALGRELTELRSQLETSRAHAALAALTGSATARRPRFQSVPGVFFALSEIGRRAGGYSSAAAGKAANIVAARMGFTPEEIRCQKQPFNELVELPDSNGKIRKMYRFSAAFAEDVARELVRNDLFAPVPPRDLEDFGVGAERYPKLSRGPLEEEVPVP